MESKIPVPTDNIFKFYALFGLLLFVFACGAQVYVIQSTNQSVFTSYVELETLKEQKAPSASVKAKISMLERLLEVSRQDKKFFLYTLGALSGIGFWVSSYGFWQWHRRTQPLIDDMQRVQLEIAKLQLLKLQSEQLGGEVSKQVGSAKAEQNAGETECP